MAKKVVSPSVTVAGEIYLADRAMGNNMMTVKIANIIGIDINNFLLFLITSGILLKNNFYHIVEF